MLSNALPPLWLLSASSKAANKYSGRATFLAVLMLMLTACGGGGATETPTTNTPSTPSTPGDNTSGVSPSIYSPSAAGLKVPLNDTGMTLAGDYPTNNQINCTSDLKSLQDCSQGRDAAAKLGILKKVGGGAAGFDFSKLGVDGQVLATQTSAWSDTGSESAGSQWSCVRDNHTGLVWETKANSGLHNKIDVYSWYSTNSDTNANNAGTTNETPAREDLCSGYQAGQVDTYCNTEAFVARVNAAKLCGFSDWRLPNIVELQSIVDYSKATEAIDVDYFPNTQFTRDYWSNFPYYTSGILTLKFNTGEIVYTQPRSSNLFVRLARGGN